MQKSQIGLLRSLLSELLSQLPELMPDVSPWRWQSHWLGALQCDPWTSRELLNTFKKLLEKAPKIAKVCLFIDGLDEYEGDRRTLVETISLLKETALSSDFKVCASSRTEIISKMSSKTAITTPTEVDES